MKETEIIKLIGLCSANYRNWPEEGKEKATMELWQTMLSDLSFEVGQSAVKAHLSRSVYPPTVADIRDAAAKITQPAQLDAIEAWGMVLDAIRKHGYYREKEAMENLPADVADMVRRFTWRELCHSENVDTLRAQWRMAWETQSKRIREYGVMPSDIRELIESSGVIKRLPGGL